MAAGSDGIGMDLGSGRRRGWALALMPLARLH